MVPKKYHSALSGKRGTFFRESQPRPLEWLYTERYASRSPLKKIVFFRIIFLFFQKSIAKTRKFAINMAKIFFFFWASRVTVYNHSESWVGGGLVSEDERGRGY